MRQKTKVPQIRIGLNQSLLLLYSLIFKVNLLIKLLNRLIPTAVVIDSNEVNYSSNNNKLNQKLPKI